MNYAALYEYLDSFQINSIDEFINNLFSELNEAQVEALVETLFQLIKTDYYAKPSFFNFYPNSSLSGKPYPCSHFACRLNNIDALARFSALYADKVLISSPIDKQFERLTKNEKIDRIDLAISICILLRLKPLVLQGIVGFTSSYVCLCKDCLSKLIKKEIELDKRLKQISKYMVDDLVKTMHCTLTRDERGIAYFAVKGLEKYGFHEQTDLLLHEESDYIKELLSKSPLENIEISPDMIKELGLAECLLLPSIEDIFQGQIIMELVDSSYLTTRVSDVEILKSLDADTGVTINSIQSKIISEALFHQIPIIGEASIESIIALRKTDEDAFVVYRDSINNILKDISNIDQKSILDLQRDIIQPEIHKMKQTIKNNKKALIKTAARDAVLSSVGISIGIFSGLLPLDYSAVLGVMGGIPAVGKVVSNLFNAFSDNCIKNNNYYFLWKLGKKEELL